MATHHRALLARKRDALQGVLLGEVPLQTDLPRRIDGVVIRRPGRGDAPPGPFYLQGAHTTAAERHYWLAQLDAANVTAIQTKVEPVGMSVLGQTLVSVALLPERYGVSHARGLALGTEGDPDLERVLATVEPSIAIAGFQLPGDANGPTREYPVAGDMIAELSQQLTGFRRASAPPRLTRFEGPEALFITGDAEFDSIGDLCGSDLIVVHSIGKATNLPVVGHAVFSAALLRESRPRSVRSIILARKQDAVVERVARAYGVETYTAAAVRSGAVARALDSHPPNGSGRL